MTLPSPATARDRERLRWIDDFVTPVAIVAAIEGLLSVGFDVRTAFFGGGAVLHTIGFWFVVAIVCIERYALTAIEPVRRGMYQLILWAAVISSCVRFEMLIGSANFVLSLTMSLTVLTGVGVFAQRLTAAMNRSLVKRDAVSLDVMDAIYGRVRDRSSGVVLERIDGQLVERVDVGVLADEDRVRATNDARARRSLLTWLVAGTGWLALAGVLVELADPGARRAVLVHGARFAVATPLLLGIASMRARRERVAQRGGVAPVRLVHRRLAAAVGVLAVAGALGALTAPMVGTVVTTASPASPAPESTSGAATAVGDGSSDPAAASDDAAHDGANPSSDAGEAASNPDAGAAASADAGASTSTARDNSASRGRGTRADPRRAFGGCGFAAGGALALARIVLAFALIITLLRWWSGRHRVRARARDEAPVDDPRQTVTAWLAAVGHAPLDAVPSVGWDAVRDVARARGIPDAAERAPRELVRALTADDPPWDADLRDLARRYEAAVFGGAPVDAAARSEWLATLSRLLPAMQASGPLPALDKRPADT